MTTPETITPLPLSVLHESPFNPRKTYAALDELAASIRAEGIHQPLVVRPRLMNPLRPDLVDEYEVVFGHRRLRAAELAGLETVPCIVRAMSDLEARRAQLTENIQRADVHPIEEAEAFGELMQQHGVTAEQLAEQIGKSVSHVYARLTLRRLLPAVRDRVLAGEVDAETALLIARLRVPKLQEKALNDLSSHNVQIDDGGRRSFRRAREILRERYTLDLAKAIFPIVDCTLVPDAGTCSACTKRTGNAPEFADLVEDHEGDLGRHWQLKGNPNLCTDPDCWDTKKKAHLKRQAEAIAAQGETVIDGNKARAAIGADGKLKGGYVPLAGELKKAADKGKVAAVTIQDPRTGKTVKAVKVDDAKAAGVKVAEPKKPASRDYDAEYRQREQAAKTLEAQAHGAEFTSSQIAEALGIDTAAVAASLSTAVVGGTLYRRQRDRQYPRAPVYWSLVDHEAARRTGMSIARSSDRLPQIMPAGSTPPAAAPAPDVPPEQVAELSQDAQRAIAAGATVDQAVNGTAPQPAPVERRATRTKPAAAIPAAAAPTTELRCALWSTGELHLARGEVTVILTPSEARTLVDYCRAWAANVPAAA